LRQEVISKGKPYFASLAAQERRVRFGFANVLSKKKKKKIAGMGSLGIRRRRAPYDAF